MERLIIEPTAQAAWHKVVTEAADRADQTLDESSESYLVFLLMRYLQRPEMVRTVIALQFLKSLNEQGRVREEQLKEVGDQCLLYAGLFPEQAQRRRVSLRYFIDIGRSAYISVAENASLSYASLFQGLARTFVGLADVLNATRAANIQPLLLAEQYAETGSAYARNTLARQTNSTPMPFGSDLTH